MKRHLLRSLVALGLGIAFVDTSALAAPFCQPTDEGQLRCPIASAADCDKIDDLPLARDLFCPAAFDAAQTMVREIAQTLGVATPTTGFFYYFATPPDPESDPDDVSQTTVPCLDTPAPYPGGSNVVRGGGLPLCHLVAYVTSPGTGAKSVKKDTAIPKDLREFPQYFATLYDPGHKDALRKFAPARRTTSWSPHWGKRAKTRSRSITGIWRTTSSTIPMSSPATRAIAASAAAEAAVGVAKSRSSKAQGRWCSLRSAAAEAAA